MDGVFGTQFGKKKSNGLKARQVVWLIVDTITFTHLGFSQTHKIGIIANFVLR